MRNRSMTASMDNLKDVAGVLIPGGFGERGVEGKIRAARFARENKIPYLGLCLGMQVATIEFARNVCGLDKANSTEFDQKRAEPGHLHCWKSSAKLKTKARACGSAPGRRRSRRHARGKNLRQRRSARAASPPLRVQHEVSRPDEGERIHDIRALRRMARSRN